MVISTMGDPLIMDFCILQELDIAIVKATNHYERPAREKNIRGVYWVFVLHFFILSEVDGDDII